MSLLKCIVNLLKRPVVRNTLILYGATFLIILPIICHNMKHSIYFSAWKDQDDGKSTLKLENNERLQHAKDYIQQLNVDSLHDMLHTTNLDHGHPIVTISIITQSRSRYIKDHYHPGYLLQTAAKFLELIQQSRHKFHVDFFICNVDSDPLYHNGATEISHLIPVVNRFNKLSLPMVHPKEKEKQDYLFCLNKSLEFRAPYVFLVEDDAFPRSDTLDVLEHILNSHIGESGSLASISDHDTPKKTRTAYIKFYHPERLLTFLSTSPERIPELISLAVFLATISMILHIKFILSSSSNHKHIHRTWFILFLYFILVVLSIGRTNLLEMRRFLSPNLYSLTPAPSCCTQAILYPIEAASQLVQFMNEKTCNNNYAKDHVIEEFTWTNNLEAFLVQPSVFTHIGLYSALRNQIVDPYLL